MRPQRIHPETEPTQGRVVAFRDGQRLLADHLAPHATQNAYPNMTYQKWVNQVANRGIEEQIVGKALSNFRFAHFTR